VPEVGSWVPEVGSRVPEKSSMTEIRPGVASDAPDIARLVLLSAEDFLPAVFGARVAAAVQTLAGRRGTLFSHRHALVAREGPETLGMILGYAGSEKAREDPRTGLALFAALGPGMLGRLGRLLALQRTIGTVRRDEWYVSNIAVFPPQRGRHVGRHLMEAAERAAALRGDCRRMVLDVETDHAPAISLYRSMGYRVRKENLPVLIERRAFTFMRMEKDLQGR
jgi:ribosomal protein S18 acetylase RimI-like enzyme